MGWERGRCCACGATWFAYSRGSVGDIGICGASSGDVFEGCGCEVSGALASHVSLLTALEAASFSAEFLPFVVCEFLEGCPRDGASEGGIDIHWYNVVVVVSSGRALVRGLELSHVGVT